MLPSNVGSKAYISDIAKKNRKNKDNKRDNKKYKIYFPVYDGKIYDPTTNKTLSILKQNEEQIIKEIQKRNNNLNLLKNETYLKNLGNNIDLEKEKRKVEEKIKMLEKENNIYMEKLEEIKIRRNAMVFQQEKELGILQNNKKAKLKKFVDDLNNKENSLLIEEKIKNIQENSKKLQLKMNNDLQRAINKKKEEMNKIEDENKKKIEDFRKKLKNEEKENIKKRNEIAKNQILELKKYIRGKPSQTTYIFQKIIDSYNKNENNLIEEKNKERKDLMKHINLKEFEEMAKKYDEAKAKQINESQLKFQKEIEKWSQISKKIPTYVNPIQKLVEENEIKIKEEEELKIKEKEKLKQLQKNFKVPKPLVIIKEKIQNNEPKKMFKPLIKSSSYSDILREKMKRNFNTSKNKKEKQEDNIRGINKNIINFRLPLITLKEKNNKEINKSFEKRKSNLEKNEIVRDYLKQRRLINEEIREKKRNNGELTNMECSKTNDIKKLIKENKMDENTLRMAKYKLDSLEEKKKQKSLLLKLNGGVGNNPELGEELCDLMIDGINAKLSIIQEIEDMDEKNNQ